MTLAILATIALPALAYGHYKALAAFATPANVRRIKEELY